MCLSPEREVQVGVGKLLGRYEEVLGVKNKAAKGKQFIQERRNFFPMLFMLQKSYSCYIKKSTSLLYYIKKNTLLIYSFLLLKTELNLLTTRGWNLLKKQKNISTLKEKFHISTQPLHIITNFPRPSLAGYHFFRKMQDPPQ